MRSKIVQILYKFTQTCLAGSLILVAVSLSINEENKRPEPTPIINALSAIETSVRQNPAPHPSKVRDLITSAQTMSSIEDFNSLPLTATEGELLESMQNDQFSQGNPFYTLNNVYPLALMLEKGVKAFRRDTYRSPQFMGGLGYDVVKYEISHPDQSKSYVLAYKEKTAPHQLDLGKKDSRPVFSLFIVPHENSQVYLSLFEDGRPLNNQILETEQALQQITARVSQSTALLSSREN